jgi:hypothetical protein
MPRTIYFSLPEFCQANKINPLTGSDVRAQQRTQLGRDAATPDGFADLGTGPAGGCAL